MATLTLALLHRVLERLILGLIQMVGFKILCYYFQYTKLKGSKMRKNIKILLLATATLGLNGCISNTLKSAVDGLGNVMTNIKPDSSVVLMSSEVIDTPKIIGVGELFFKNISTGKEESIDIYNSSYSLPAKKLTPGTYKITRWVFASCFVKTPSNYCKKWHDFGGINPPLAKDNIFTIKKGETLYLGHVIIDSKNMTLTLINNGPKDTMEYKNKYSGLNTRNIKNISNSINIKSWKFKVTGAGFFK
jgi:hypothetical protein